jgi:hypothetical protein
MAARELTPQEVADGERNIIGQDLSATQVQALLRNMDVSKRRYRNLKGTPQHEEKLKEENRVLYYNYPSLFQMHMEDRVDATLFEMLALKRKIEKGELTAESASAIIGKKLYEKFLPEVVGSTAPVAPTMSYEDYYRSLQ